MSHNRRRSPAASPSAAHCAAWLRVRCMAQVVSACCNPEEVALPDEADADDAGPALAVPAPVRTQLRHLLVRRAFVQVARIVVFLSGGVGTQVLDVNGLLVERTFTALRDAQDEPVEPDTRVGQFHIYNRPGLQRFVAMLLERFVVGVWSSAKQHNLRGIVTHIFGDAEERLAFVWGQEACTYAGTSGKSKPLFLKELCRVWTAPAFAAFGPNNTLLVDDDEYKAARNPPHTAIHPAKVRGAAGRDEPALCVCLIVPRLRTARAVCVDSWRRYGAAGGRRAVAVLMVPEHASNRVRLGAAVPLCRVVEWEKSTGSRGRPDRRDVTAAATSDVSCVIVRLPRHCTPPRGRTDPPQPAPVARRPPQRARGPGTCASASRTAPRWSPAQPRRHVRRLRAPRRRRAAATGQASAQSSFMHF